MRRALDLAARGFTPPNPMVGCVIVKDGIKIGEGYHTWAGQPHAEVEALRAAGADARGATVYVTLEPCCHTGRTPPCTDALIAAGVSRVVVAVRDLDARVKGRGLKVLQDAGIEVECPLLEQQAAEINRAFFHFQQSKLPFVTLKTAVTLDGKIATSVGDSQWITGPPARREVHRMRAQSGAVLTGIGTVLKDNPRLDARRQNVPYPRQPLRVIVDSGLRTPLDSAVLQLARSDPKRYPLLIVTTEKADESQLEAFRTDGVEILQIPSDPDGRVDLGRLMIELGKRQVISVFTECGSILNASLVREKLVHEFLFFIAPKLIGGNSAPGAIGELGVSALPDAVQLTLLGMKRVGPDVLLRGKPC